MTDLTEALFDDTSTAPLDPFDLFEVWLAEARDAEVNDPTAMTLATVDAAGMPDARVVLLNGRDRRGFVFFTNLESDKGRELRAHPVAALLFHWKSLRRQIRIRGAVEQVSDAEADAYFATRPRPSRIGAHASAQSRPLESRDALLARADEIAIKFGEGEIPRPAYWSGFRVTPTNFEFWKDGAFRLHDRVRFERDGDTWRRQRLNP